MPQAVTRDERIERLGNGVLRLQKEIAAQLEDLGLAPDFREADLWLLLYVLLVKDLPQAPEPSDDALYNRGETLMYDLPGYVGFDVLRVVLKQHPALREELVAVLKQRSEELWRFYERHCAAS